MKTLAVRQPWVSLIAEGDKTIEVRSWRTAHRGPLLFVASGKPLQVDCDGEIYTLPAGIQVCIADVTGCRPFLRADIDAACFHADEYDTGLWAWTLANVRQVAPTPHKGRLRLYETPDNQITPA
ncbi:MAG: ASCH domain-containing protein [Rhodocyclales bacterium]|nr:ASCH domain-containing protein [Rhodocyclales bacterium]